MGRCVGFLGGGAYDAEKVLFLQPSTGAFTDSLTFDASSTSLPSQAEDAGVWDGTFRFAGMFGCAPAAILRAEKGPLVLEYEHELQMAMKRSQIH